MWSRNRASCDLLTHPPSVRASVAAQLVTLCRPKRLSWPPSEAVVSLAQREHIQRLVRRPWIPCSATRVRVDNASDKGVVTDMVNGVGIKASNVRPSVSL